MDDLLSKRCVPCEGGAKPLEPAEVERYLKEVPGWSISQNYRKISREFNFKDFKKAMTFVSEVAEIAEAENHHPDLHIFYNRVNVELWTHAVGGLSENDFILAAKVSAVN